MAQSHCPICNTPILPTAKECKKCGIDLSAAAALMERATGTRELTKTPSSPEVLVPRLGEYLVEQKFIQPSELQIALDYKKRVEKNGGQVLLGQALIQLGYIDQRTLDNAVTWQIFFLQGELQKSNKLLENRVRARTRELQRALIKLEELDKLKNEFVSNVSHELRTPLTHIKGYLTLISDQTLGPLTEDQTEGLDVINSATARLEQLIDDLIRFAAASKGQITIHPKPLAFQAVANAVIGQCFAKAEEKNIFLDLNVPHDLPLLMADEENLSAALYQLVDNAIKFTMPGGMVRVQASRRSDHTIIAVMDNGIGISPEEQQELFQPFHQLDGSSTREQGGTGLGLSLVQKILEKHGTEIDVQSIKGQGSRFSFTLPFAT